MKVRSLQGIAHALGVSCDALLRPNLPTAHTENVIHMPENVPDEYLPGIERIVQVCIE